MNDKVIIHYFPLNARAGLIRAALTYSKANWEDKRVSFEEWPAFKSSGKLEFGQMPALEVNGNIYTQTLAIEHLVGKKHELLGSNAEEEYDILSLLCSREDLYLQIRQVLLPIFGDEKNNVENAKIILLNLLPNYLKIYEKRITNKTGKYVVGDKFSFADIFLTLFVHIIFRNESLKSQFGNVLTENAPNLAKFTEGIENNELKEYFEKSHIKGAF